MAEFCGQGLAPTPWAYAVLVWPVGPLLESLAASSLRRLSSFGTQGLTNTAWSCAALALADRPLRAALSSAALRRIGVFHPQGLSSTAWAFSRREWRDLPLLDALSSSARPKLLSARDIANLSWAFSSLGFRDGEPLLDAIASAALRRMRACGAQGIANTAWSFSLLALGHRPLLAALAASALRLLREFGCQGLANTAWAWSVLPVPHAPLRQAIASSSLPKISDFGVQSLSNMAWACARRGWADAPLLAAISAASLRTRSEGSREVLPSTPRHTHPLLWSLHRLSMLDRARAVWDDWRALDQLPSALAFGVRLMDSEWARRALAAAQAWELVRRGAPFDSVRCVVAGWLACPGPPAGHPAGATGTYSKMSALVEFLEVSAGTTVASTIAAVEAYSALGRGMWLKVAGGSKAEVLASALLRRMIRHGEVAIEFGLFVGYTAMRLAYHSRPRGTDQCRFTTTRPRVVSLELDPIHACIARHVVNLSSLAAAAESLVGHSKDLLPALDEMYGESSGGFAFMDQRGTTFHVDLQRVERLRLFTDAATLTADNTVKPGAPIFLWHLAHGSTYDPTCWALSEFQSDLIEDYVATARFRR